MLLLPGNGARKLLLAVGVEDAVEMLALIPSNGARKLLDDCVGYPKLKVMMMHSSMFSLSMKPRFIKPGGEGSRF